MYGTVGIAVVLPNLGPFDWLKVARTVADTREEESMRIQVLLVQPSGFTFVSETRTSPVPSE